MAMIKKLLFTLSLCVLVGGSLYAQTIKGKVTDPSGNPVPYLQLLLKQEDKVVNGGRTDDQGEYQIFGIPAGTYDLTAGGTMTCLSSYTQTGITVSSGVKFLDITINCSSAELETVEIRYKPPIFDQDQTVSTQKLSAEEVRKNPARSITGALSNLSGVASVDGNVASVRGNRDYGQQTIIDGVRVRSNSGITMQALEGLELIQGGIPAEYGDGTSFTIITTRGVSKDYHGSVDLRSSLEGYWQTQASATITGPILKGKTPQDPPRMGFLLSAQGSFDLDGHPARGGTWAAKPGVIKDIMAKPVDWNYNVTTNKYIPYYRADHLEKENFQKLRVRKNAEDWGLLVNGKIDIMGGGKDARGKSKNNLRLSISGSYEYTSARDWSRADALFNSKNNSSVKTNELRLSARLNHRVKTDTAANAILKNVMYDINVNYTIYNAKQEDMNHKDNFFAYGYIGKFKTERRDIYDWKEFLVINPFLPADSPKVAMWAPYLLAYQSVNNVTFDANEYLNNGNYYNPDLVPYTLEFAKFLEQKTGGDINKIWNMFGRPDFDLFRVNYALLNGSSVQDIANNLFTPPGVPYQSYTKIRRETIGAKANLSLNLQDHEIKFGFEFEKRTDRNYWIAAANLWQRMTDLTYDDRYHSPDLENPFWKYGIGDSIPNIVDYGNGFYFIEDTLTYNIINELSHFDQSFRAKYGAKYGVTDVNQFLDINSYDPNDFSLDMFSNYELLNSGFPYLGYSGYDYTGKFSNKKINLKNFFSGKDLHDKGKYSIGAFEPIYLAIFLQDKFAISNLLFSLGLRLDYFNANQPVLRDAFLLRDAYNVGQLKGHKEWANFDNFPDNVKNSWVPYVSSADNDITTAPHTVVAYRDGKTWYNSLGQEVPDPATYLGAASGPIIKNPILPEEPTKTSDDAFTDFKPQWNVMPRISFSFPVSTNSLFYAHYNIITNRAPNLQIDPVAYLFIPQFNTDRRIVNNPKLKAERNVDYEIGFRQKVGENTALNFSAYYSEKRDQIQSYRLTGAYPNTYYSYENLDFGTVQGFGLEINMRGAKNLSFRAGYTLSFAKGTGSTTQSNLAIIASGQPNLRTLTNLNHDQRHRITATIDLRFEDGTNYNGPVTVKQKKGTDTKKEIRWLENAGVMLIFAGQSGMPYSRSGIVYSALNWGEQTKPQLKGSINGANMPWTFKVDLHVEKTFTFNLANKKDKNESGKRTYKAGMLTVYLDFQNLLNLKNVQNVYDFTGSADDDGYLSSPLFKSYITTSSAPGTASSATNYYQMMIANPYNYTQPFRVYLGVMFGF